MGIQQSLQTINPIQQHGTRFFPPLHQNNTKQSKWPSSSLSSSPPWPLLPSPPPRVLLTRTPRSRSPARTTPPSAATVRRSPAATAARIIGLNCLSIPILAIPIQQACGSNVAACCQTGDAEGNLINLEANCLAIPL